MKRGLSILLISYWYYCQIRSHSLQQIIMNHSRPKFLETCFKNKMYNYCACKNNKTKGVMLCVCVVGLKEVLQIIKCEVNNFEVVQNLKMTFNKVDFILVWAHQTDGVAMGSPLGPALANIFVGYHESKLFFCVQKPTIYFRYVDDTFAIFKQEGDVDDFLVTLNCLHPALKFSFEKEQDGKLPFLDILVERTELGFETSVYRKPTFSGQYIRWKSFSPRKRKTNLIATLVHRALMICTKNKLKQEIDFIKKVLLDNGYPEAVVALGMCKVCKCTAPPPPVADLENFGGGIFSTKPQDFSAENGNSNLR